jgi:hypothetical protein
MQGRVDEAGNALARLRLRRSTDADMRHLLKVGSGLILPRAIRSSRVQIELVEMQVETELVRRTKPTSSKSARPSEVASWTALFGPALRARTAIAVLVMFFQREFSADGHVTF